MRLLRFVLALAALGAAGYCAAHLYRRLLRVDWEAHFPPPPPPPSVKPIQSLPEPTQVALGAAAATRADTVPMFREDFSQLSGPSPAAPQAEDEAGASAFDSAAPAAKPAGKRKLPKLKMRGWLSGEGTSLPSGFGVNPRETEAGSTGAALGAGRPQAQEYGGQEAGQEGAPGESTQGLGAPAAAPAAPRRQMRSAGHGHAIRLQEPPPAPPSQPQVEEQQEE